MSIIREKITFQNGSEMIEVAPSSMVEIHISYTNPDQRSISIVADFDCPDVKTLDGSKKEFNFPPGTPRTYKETFVTPLNFSKIRIVVKTYQKSGFFGGYGGGQVSKTTDLLITPMTPRVTVITTSAEQSALIDKAKGMSLAFVPNPTLPPVSAPVIGDVTTEPISSITLPTTADINLVLQCGPRELTSLATAIKNASIQLEKAAADQNMLRFIIEELKTYYNNPEKGLTAEGPIGSLHLKVKGRGLTYNLFVTQVSPKEDERVNQKILTMIKDSNTALEMFAVVTMGVDDRLVDIALTNRVNITDIFHGIEVRGVFTGDAILAEFIVKKLKLPQPTVYEDANTKGSYSPSAFENALDTIKLPDQKPTQSSQVVSKRETEILKELIKSGEQTRTGNAQSSNQPRRD